MLIVFTNTLHHMKAYRIAVIFQGGKRSCFLRILYVLQIYTHDV